MNMIPPFKITPTILKFSQDISLELGKLTGAKIDLAPLRLRRLSRIKTIQASLAIEGNTLNIDQITDLLEGKRVIGPERDLIEVKNALELYERLSSLNPLSQSDFLASHKTLMKGLTDENGKWRSGGVGIFKGDHIAHLPPPAKRVPLLMKDLFSFLKGHKEIPWLLKACIFHYEFEFIHPFADGNGRMGRLWQQLLLMKEHAVFAYIPIEVLIRENQQDYYTVLGDCDKAGDSTLFIEFSLKQILKALQKYSETTRPVPADGSTRIDYAREKLIKDWFSRKDYRNLHKEISTATASRDLQKAVEDGILLKTGDKSKTRYAFVNARGKRKNKQGKPSI